VFLRVGGHAAHCLLVEGQGGQGLGIAQVPQLDGRVMGTRDDLQQELTNTGWVPATYAAPQCRAKATSMPSRAAGQKGKSCC
jgi:hypothetical protein